MNAEAPGIEEIRESEEHNYQTAKKLLGDTTSLVDDLTDLYHALAEIATKAPFAAKDEYLTALHILAASQYCLTIGSLAALRGHTTDALRDCRLAIELCVFAAHVKRDPASALIWVNASTSDAAYAAYRKKFKPESCSPLGFTKLGSSWLGKFTRPDQAWVTDITYILGGHPFSAPLWRTRFLG
jgi:hypothetical protein